MDCHKDFIFTAEEQEFFKERVIVNLWISPILSIIMNGASIYLNDIKMSGSTAKDTKNENYTNM